MTPSSLFYKAVDGTGRALKAVAGALNVAIVKPAAAGVRWAYSKKPVNKAANATGHGLKKTAAVTGKSLATAFNWASGNTMLKKNGLKRGGLGVLGTAGLGYAGYFGTAAALPAATPLAPAFAAVAGAALVGVLVGARIQAHYIVGKHQAQTKKAGAQTQKLQAAALSA